MEWNFFERNGMEFFGGDGPPAYNPAFQFKKPALRRKTKLSSFISSILSFLNWWMKRKLVCFPLACRAAVAAWGGVAFVHSIALLFFISSINWLHSKDCFHYIHFTSLSLLCSPARFHFNKSNQINSINKINSIIWSVWLKWASLIEHIYCYNTFFSSINQFINESIAGIKERKLFFFIWWKELWIDELWAACSIKKINLF